jgi:hypothetical protein
MNLPIFPLIPLNIHDWTRISINDLIYPVKKYQDQAYRDVTQISSKSLK